MRRRALTLFWVAATALVLAAGTAACSDDEGSETSDTTETATPAAVSCPDGTDEDDRLCVGTSDEAEESASLIRAFFDDGDFNAVIVGVWQDEEPVVVGALGESMTDVPATVDMHHRIGNISAPFLTTVFLQLVDEGVLAIDDTLDTWYPDLPAADQITLADLARSTSGYEHHPATDGFLEAFYADPFQHWSPDELIAFGTADGTSFEPGTDWQFSDTNLLILGEVLEAATGESTHEMIRERIIEPEGLDNTTTPETALLADPVLHGFTDERGVWEEATFWNPTWVPYGGDMASNQEDVARWIEMVARGDLLPPELHEEQVGPRRSGSAGTPRASTTRWASASPTAGSTATRASRATGPRWAATRRRPRRSSSTRPSPATATRTRDPTRSSRSWGRSWPPTTHRGSTSETERHTGSEPAISRVPDQPQKVPKGSRSTSRSTREMGAGPRSS